MKYQTDGFAISGHGRRGLLGLLAAAAIFTPTVQASAPIFTVLLNSGYAALAQDSNGALYGVELNAIIIDTIAPPAIPGGAWTATTIYNGGSDLGTPSALVAGPTAAGQLAVLYATAATGGSSNLGAVFSLTPPESPGGGWTETVLHSFTGGSDPGNPAGLIIAGNGVLYGFTESYTGGPSTVFSLTPSASPGGSWTEAVLFTFDINGAQGPLLGSLIAAGGSGRPELFGTTSAGGDSGCGTVYRLNPPASGSGSWLETVLHNFTCLDDGGVPGQIVIGKHGVLYGCTAFGGVNENGTVYSLAPPSQPGGLWMETVLYSPSAAGEPNSVELGPDGIIYGSNTGGGYGPGTLFSLKPPAVSGGSWTERTLHVFNAADRANRTALLTYHGVLYGSALGSAGIVYSLAP
jgi:uncharacterized repeat protein (TIGR03803 family)